MQTEISLYTQDHRPLLGDADHPSPLGAGVLALLPPCCGRYGYKLLAVRLAPDRLTFTLEGALPLPQLRRLLLALRQETTPLHESGDNAGYRAVLWQRQPIIRTLP